MKTPGELRTHLATILLIAVAHAQEPLPDQPATRTYDVRDLTLPETHFLPADATPRGFAPAAFEPPTGRAPALELGDLAMLIRICTSVDYWDQDDVGIHAEDGGFLLLTCDEVTHTQARSIIGKLRQLLFEPVQVEVHELPAASLAGRSALLSAADADALLQEAGAHRVHLGRTNPRQPLVLGSTWIADREDDAHDPASAHDPLGTTWTVHVTRTLNDAMLLSVSGSRRVDAARPEAGRPVAHLATCRASAYLQPGQAMLVGTDAADGVVLCVRLHRQKPLSGRNCAIGSCTAYPIAHLVRRHAMAATPRAPFAGDSLFPESPVDSMPPVSDEARLTEWLRYQVEPDSWDGSPNAMSHVDGNLFVCAPAPTQDAIAALLQSLQDLDARQFSLEVRHGEVAAAPDDAVAGGKLDALAQSLPGHCLVTLSGSRGAHLSATTHTPAAPWLATGVLLRGNVSPMDQGAALLTMDLTLLGRDAVPTTAREPDVPSEPTPADDVPALRCRGGTVVTLGEWTLLKAVPVEGARTHAAVLVRLRSL